MIVQIVSWRDDGASEKRAAYKIAKLRTADYTVIAQGSVSVQHPSGYSHAYCWLVLEGRIAVDLGTAEDTAQ